MSYGPPMGYGFPPRPGMIPMGTGPPPMMSGPPIGAPPIQRPLVPRPNLPPNQAQNKNKLIPQDIPEGEGADGGKPPVTTVFVGSISERAPDNMIRTLLQRCGNIVSWKRVQGADGKLQAFGFCEFEVPDATLRCLRLLNEWMIADKKLVVKVDDKTRGLLEDYEKNHKADEEEMKREDRLAQAALEAVMREFAAELRRNAPQPVPVKPKETFGPVSSGPKADEGLDGIVKDEDAKNLINREINRFREAYKDDEVVTEIRVNREKERKESSRSDHRSERESSKSRRRSETPEKSRSERRDKERSARDREKERERANEKEKERTSERERPARSDRDRENKEREERPVRRKSRSRSREGSRGNVAVSTKIRSPRKLVEDEDEDPDERFERLRLERQLRDKEQAYQERLKNWEVRERKKIREFERDRQRSEERKSEEKKEARRLREFLEDYDDDRDDPKYYKGNQLVRRMKEREKEAEADNRDRHKEKEEIDELRKKLEEEGHPDPEAEITKRQFGTMAAANAALTRQAPVQHQKPEKEPKAQVQHQQQPTSTTQDRRSRSRERSEVLDESSRIIIPKQPLSTFTDAPTTDSNSSIHLTTAITLHKNSDQTDASRRDIRKRINVKDIFNDEDEAGDDTKKKRPLVPLDYEDEKKKSAKLTVEDKRAAIKRLIDKIPTDKYDLFSWNMEWDQVDQVLLDSRVKPWVNKKITEYIGEEEPTLTDFICQKVMNRSSAQSILADVAMVLDEEAETFVVKMWRLLVYETEAKKAGLVK